MYMLQDEFLVLNKHLSTLSQIVPDIYILLDHRQSFEFVLLHHQQELAPSVLLLLSMDLRLLHQNRLEQEQVELQVHLYRLLVLVKALVLANPLEFQLHLYRLLVLVMALVLPETHKVYLHLLRQKELFGHMHRLTLNISDNIVNNVQKTLLHVRGLDEFPHFPRLSLFVLFFVIYIVQVTTP